MQRQIITIAGVELELFTAGEGPPILFLHGAQGFSPEHPYVPLLSAKHRLLAPSHPGFGKSSLPDWIDAVDDVAYVYLELLEQLQLDQIDVIGCSLGGWLAAEIATKVPSLLRRLVLVGPVGVKTGPVDQLDIPDIFALPQGELEKLLFHDPGRMRTDPSRLSDEQLAISVRNRETLSLLVWEPYMHNPKLRHRLHRVMVPTLFLRGESDGLVTTRYIEAYSRLLPNARIETIPTAGHAPQVEQPEAFARSVLAFLEAAQ